MRRQLLTMTCALLLGFASRALADTATSLEETTFAGSIAANWQLQGLDGRSYRLSDFKGKAIVLSFWATWCAPCRVETKWLVQLHRQYHERGVEILAVSMDEETDDAEVARFAAKYSVPYPILLRGQSIAPKYGGMRYLPQMFFIDRSGRIVSNTRGIQDQAALETEIVQLLR